MRSLDVPFFLFELGYNEIDQFGKEKSVLENNLLDNETLVIEITDIITKARNNVIKNVNNAKIYK